MKKTIAGAVSVLCLLGASVASAQSYYTPMYSSSCTRITSDLTVGSKGAQVRALQTFLVSQNYPGGGSWMITGNYGAATQAAVRIFQQRNGLAQTGVADAQTRAAINAVSCGGAPYQSGYQSGIVGGYVSIPSQTSYNPFSYNPTFPSYSYPYNYSYPNYTYPTYPNNSYYNNCGTFPYYYPCTSSSNVTLTSLSPNSGAPGTQVTVYGTGFDAYNNVYVGGTTLRDIPSWNSTMLSFTMPQNVVGQVSVSVGNSRGTSNALTFQAPGQPLTCGTYPYGACCGTYGYAWGYNHCPPTNPTGPISITYLSPNSGGVGNTVTVFGNGFTTTNNTVRFGNGIITNLNSYDGRSLSFTVPSTLSGYGYQPIGLGSYDVSVTNSYGAVSNTVPFTVTSLSSTGLLSITNVSGPTSLNTNQTGTWSFTVNSQSGTQLYASVRWGDENQYGYAASAEQSILGSGSNNLTFTHAYMAPGTYTVTFTVRDAQGRQNSSTISVNVSGSQSNTVALSYITPTFGPINSVIQLYGTGFTANNTVKFGIGGKLNVPSYNNGTLIYFTVPQFVSPCDLQTPGTYCAQYQQQIYPGPIQVSVQNQNGTSQVLYFQVQ